MVSDFLTLIGAMNSTLAFEEARVMRQVSGSVNRIRNFEDANMNKAAAAAAVQLVDIEYIGSARGLDTLPEKLREAAELRLNNPEATLSELSELAEVSKSGLNHRFAKLSQWAQELREQGAGRIKTEE
ncbi:putative sporulation transcription regulator WhiA [bioreactor metagenome]|uniref:Putative sporulation transcription regulator WhiA n=1 Tax=bioreactor metagenome TaxID=1076179 RepID=A0A645FWA8_9ZZZZ